MMSDTPFQSTAKKQDTFRVIVIGRGLIGSAAARYLAEMTDGIACIGPDEPTAREGHKRVFASHYDEGRMTRHVDPVREWSISASQSIGRYRDLEARSGLRFYEPVGYLGLGTPDSDYNALCAEMASAHGVTVEQLNAAEIRARYPYLSVDDDADGLFEKDGAGYISPRRMVEAQTRLAEAAGAQCIRQEVCRLRAVSSGIEVELADGTTLRAERVLVATGAFTAACGLSPVDLGLTVYGRTTVLARIEGEAAQLLRDMPTVIDAKTDAYILPPILYPDGHRYIKIGVGDDSDPRFETLEELQNWFISPGAECDRKTFKHHLKELIPVLSQCREWHTDTCAVTKTLSGLPIIDFAEDSRIAIAVGGCGKGAKGADEWGRIAAELIGGAPWSSDITREKLRRSNT